MARGSEFSAPSPPPMKYITVKILPFTVVYIKQTRFERHRYLVSACPFSNFLFVVKALKQEHAINCVILNF